MVSRILPSMKKAAGALCKYSGVLHLYETMIRITGQSNMAILVFHRVTDDIPEDGLTVSSERFDSMCAFLRNKFRVVPLAEIFRLVINRETIPHRTVAITFDDTYRNNLHAAEVLREHELPATFFLPTAYINSDHVYSWDRLLPVRLPNLTWEDVRYISELGFDIGSHSVTHRDMAQLSDREAISELSDSKKTLEDKLGRDVPFFAYPYGGEEHFRSERTDLITACGYRGAVSAYGGLITRATQGPVLPRKAAPGFHDFFTMELYLTGALRWYHYLKMRAGVDMADHVNESSVASLESRPVANHRQLEPSSSNVYTEP